MKNEESPSRHPLFLLCFTNTIFLIIVTIVCLVLNIILSTKTNNWHWFARSGALIVIIGGIFSFRSTLRLTKKERIRRRNMNIIERFTNIEKNNQEKDSIAIMIGVFMIVIGTIIWAYGDLVYFFRID